jgi:thiol-disulfide isomerase/thioredoxin
MVVMTHSTASTAKSARLAAWVTAAALAFVACAGSETASTDQPAADAADQSVDDGAAGGPATEAGAEPAADDPAAAVAVLQVSPALAVEGEALALFESADTDPAIGTMAPVITGQQFDGSDITIGGASSAPTMLVFLAHWCPHCNDEIPELVTLRDAGSLPTDLDIVGISTAINETRDNYPPSDWIVEKDWTWPVLADQADSLAIQLYGGTGFPFTVLLDADGKVLGRKSGNEPADKIKSWIESTLGP